MDIEEYNFLLHQLELEMKKLEKLDSEKTLVIGELYNRFRAIITQLQLSMQIYPTSYTAHYYCEPTKEEKEIIAEEIEKKLQKLKTLFDKGLITEDEYITATFLDIFKFGAADFNMSVPKVKQNENFKF